MFTQTFCCPLKIACYLKSCGIVQAEVVVGYNGWFSRVSLSGHQDASLCSLYEFFMNASCFTARSDSVLGVAEAAGY